MPELRRASAEPLRFSRSLARDSWLFSMRLARRHSRAQAAACNDPAACVRLSVPRPVGASGRCTAPALHLEDRGPLVYTRARACACGAPAGDPESRGPGNCTDFAISPLCAREFVGHY